MNLNRYFARHRYRVPVMLLIAQLAILLLLNAPFEW